MFVYVAEFEGRPGLVKVGVALDVKTRMQQLRKCHGKVMNVSEFNVGHDGYEVERFVHRKYTSCNVVLGGKCDGHTEFFDGSIRAGVKSLLEGVSKSIICTPAPSEYDPLNVAVLPTQITTPTQFERKLQSQRNVYRQRAAEWLLVERNRIDKFLAKVLYPCHKPDEQILRFKRIDWEEVYHIVEAVKSGVDVKNATDALVTCIKLKHAVKLTKWRALVFLSAAVYESSRMKSARSNYSVWGGVSGKSNKAYMAMLLDGNDVTPDFVYAITFKNGNPWPTSAYEPKVYGDMEFCENDVIRLIGQRRLQIDSV